MDANFMHWLAIIFAAPVAALGYRWIKRAYIKHQINNEIYDVLNMLTHRELGSQAMWTRARSYEYLTKVEGFQPVITLLRHRHVSRALTRLKEFCKEWQENGLKLYNRK